MPMILIPAILPSLFQPVPMTSWGVPYDHPYEQLAEEKMTLAWFTNGSAQYTGPFQSGNLQHYSSYLEDP